MTEQMFSTRLVRRLAIAKQQLCDARPPATSQGILDLVRQLGCLQLDPISAVAKSHQLVLWSRIGAYDLDLLDQLLWRDRALFEYWAHAASIVLTEDYPIHRMGMRRYLKGDTRPERLLQAWLQTNRRLRRSILTQLRRSGPLPARSITDSSEVAWGSRGWTAGRNVDRMLACLWRSGRITVTGRAGGQRLWNLTESWLPQLARGDRMSQRQVVREAAQRSLRALGVATAGQIQEHFTCGMYPGLTAVLNELERCGRILRVNIGDADRRWRGPWYVHTEDLELASRLDNAVWQPRTTLLSPFDNLIRDRVRIRLFFDFDFRMEIYVPRDRRQHGYYVMPILHGDRLVGRIDPAFDRRRKVLFINAVHAQPEGCSDRATGSEIAAAIEDLARFLKATDIQYREKVPSPWSRWLW